MQPLIPLCKVPRKSRPSLPRLFDWDQYRKRNVIKRLFSWLKENVGSVRDTTSWQAASRPWLHWSALKNACARLFRQTLGRTDGLSRAAHAPPHATGTTSSPAGILGRELDSTPTLQNAQTEASTQSVDSPSL
jgi:hypothetical protein